MSEQRADHKRIAVIGAGPAGLFLYKRLIESGASNLRIDIFEASTQLGGGMPYSDKGANVEHITNVSCNEIPTLVTTILDWIDTLPESELQRFSLNREKLSEHNVLPRLLFGEYLGAQFELLRQQADNAGIKTRIHLGCTVTDVSDDPEHAVVLIEIAGNSPMEFDFVVICTGHTWPRVHEGKVPGYFDSPYPPSKLANRYDHSVAIRGSSLTAVDAVRTIARHNGHFEKDGHDKLHFRGDPAAPDFKIVMHSRHGLLPCVRFHTDTPQVGQDALIPDDDLQANMARNDGFLTLDFLFDRGFKQPLREKDPEFYERIRDMSIEQFVENMLSLRESVDAFSFFKGEYAEAQKSIRRHESIYWKEMLSALSFAMNYPAKHLSAEDMYRHQHVLMPLISIVIAFVPQSSCEELIALHDAGRLELVNVGADSHVEPGEDGGGVVHYSDESGAPVEVPYDTFVDAIGQRHLPLSAFPFESLKASGSVSPARLKFRSIEQGARMMAEGNKDVERDADDSYFMKVAGLAITDNFEIIAMDGAANSRIYMMAVPYMGGYNPDYSGLDFCEEAGGLIVDRMFERVAS